MILMSGYEELIEGAGIPLLLSMFATLVRTIRFGHYFWRTVIGNLITSIFVGQFVFWGLDYYSDLSMSVKAALVLAAAYCGSGFLDALYYRVRKVIREGYFTKHKGEHHGSSND